MLSLSRKLSAPTQKGQVQGHAPTRNVGGLGWSGLSRPWPWPWLWLWLFGSLSRPWPRVYAGRPGFDESFFRLPIGGACALLALSLSRCHLLGFNVLCSRIDTCAACLRFLLEAPRVPLLLTDISSFFHVFVFCGWANRESC